MATDDTVTDAKASDVWSGLLNPGDDGISRIKGVSYPFVPVRSVIEETVENNSFGAGTDLRAECSCHNLAFGAGVKFEGFQLQFIFTSKCDSAFHSFWPIVFIASVILNKSKI